jgi:hypothetical protein
MPVFVVEDDLAVGGHDVPLDETLERVGLHHRPRKVGGIAEKTKQPAALKIFVGKITKMFETI